MTTTALTTTRPSSATVTTAGAAATLVGVAGILYGAHGWTEIALTVPVLVVVAAAVFGYVVPRALQRPSAGGTALALAVPAALLTLPAFWSGLPVVLGVAGLLVGAAGRNARTGGGRCIAAIVLGAIAVVGYLVIYLVDGVVAGNGGFLVG